MVESAIFLAARETELCCQVELHCRTVFRGQILTSNAFRYTTDTQSHAPPNGRMPTLVPFTKPRRNCPASVPKGRLKLGQAEEKNQLPYFRDAQPF